MKGTPQFPQCGFSGQVVQILDYLGVPYKGVNVLEDDGIRQGIKEYSNWPTIPQLYVKGEFVGGCDIIREMFQAGELQSSSPTRASPPSSPLSEVSSPASRAAERGPAASCPSATCRVVAGIHAFPSAGQKGVDGRQKAGHDEEKCSGGSAGNDILSGRAPTPTSGGADFVEEYRDALRQPCR